MKRSMKITIGSIVGIVIIAGIALVANGDLLQGRLSRNSRVLPAYDETKVERPTREQEILPAYDEEQYDKYKYANTCQHHPGGTFELGDGLEFVFNDGSKYEIKLTGMQKETYEGNSTYLVKFEVNGKPTFPMRMHDIRGNDIQIMVRDIEQQTQEVDFNLYKGCDLLTSGPAQLIEDGYSEIECNTYIGSGKYDVHYCDRIKQNQDSKVAAYVESVDANLIYILYRIGNQSGEFKSSIPNLQINGDDKFGGGYFGLNLYSDEYDYDSNSKSASIEVKSSCQQTYEKCVETNEETEKCMKKCSYEEVEGFEYTIVDGKYMAQTPEGESEWAQCSAIDMKYSIKNGEDYIGFDYPFPKIVGIYPYPDDVYAQAFGYGVEGATGYYYQDGCTEELIISDNNMSGHEVNHNFMMSTAVGRIYGKDPQMEEGLVNYISSIWQENFEEFECLDNGWKGSSNSELKPYEKDTLSGQCFWKRLEDEYGHDTFVEIMQELDESRYIDSQAGRKKPVLLFKDIINPIIGSDVLEQRAYDWYGFTEEEF